MKKLITANDVREADGNGLKTITFVLKESIVTPEARVVAEQLGIALVEKGAKPLAATTDNAPPRSERQRIREEIIAQLPEGQFTETLVAQLIEKVEQEQKTRSGSGMQPGFSAVTGKGGIKVIDGSSVRFGRFDGAQEPCVGLTDLVTGADGSSMAAGFMQWENGFFPWTLNYDEIDMVLEGELHIRHEGETLIGKAGDVMFIPKGSSIEFGTTSHVRFLYVAWPANWQEC
jgi:ethanolamine utilization protein EutQ